jgi:hypothetical protein
MKEVELPLRTLGDFLVHPHDLALDDLLERSFLPNGLPRDVGQSLPLLRASIRSSPNPADRTITIY